MSVLKYKFGEKGHKQFAPLKTKENPNNKGNIWKTEVKNMNQQFTEEILMINCDVSMRMTPVGSYI